MIHINKVQAFNGSYFVTKEDEYSEDSIGWLRREAQNWEFYIEVEEITLTAKDLKDIASMLDELNNLLDKEG